MPAAPMYTTSIHAPNLTIEFDLTFMLLPLVEVVGIEPTKGLRSHTQDPARIVSYALFLVAVSLPGATSLMVWRSLTRIHLSSLEVPDKIGYFRA